MECKRPNLLSFQVHVKILNILLCIFLFFALRKSSVILIFIGNSTGNVIKVPCYNFLIHLIFWKSKIDNSEKLVDVNRHLEKLNENSLERRSLAIVPFFIV